MTLIFILTCGLMSTTVLAGPVILGGDDLDWHGSYSNANGNEKGWLYIEKALANMYQPGCISRINNDGCIAVLGAPSSNTTAGHAGAAVYYTGNVKLGRCVKFYDTAANINLFFAGLSNGTINPAIIYIPSPYGTSGLDSAENNALTANAAAIQSFVNSGGGLLAHVVPGYQGYGGWLTTAMPGLSVSGLCQSLNATLTAAGSAAFPALANSDINSTAGACHASFSGNLGGLTVLAQDGSNPKLNFIIGGGCNTTIATPGFTSNIVCLGQPTSFTDTSTGAISWNWDFGDGTSSNQQNPGRIYNSAGTYTAKLCVNGSTTNCVQHTVTVKPVPAAPVITGPDDTCQGATAVYSVQPQSGVTYTWNISGGTPATATGTSVQINWNAPGGGDISVTAMFNGCASTTRFHVNDCNLYLWDCCMNMKITESAGPPVHQGQDIYQLAPNLSVSSTIPIIRVTATIISSKHTSSSCETNGPINSYITSAASPPGFASSIPVNYGREVIWHSNTFSGVSMTTPLSFPFNIQFPLLPAPWYCWDVVTFCVKYQITDAKCRTCEIIRCYSFTRSHIIWIWNPVGAAAIIVGQPFPTDPTITVLGDDGKPNLKVRGKATVRIKPGTGTRGARLSGQTTVEVINGSATFRGLSIDKAGKGYVLVVGSSESPETFESKPFDVAPR